jgi:hypothetical protein
MSNLAAQAGGPFDARDAGFRGRGGLGTLSASRALPPRPAVSTEDSMTTTTTLIPENVEALLAEAIAALPPGAEGSEVREALHPLEAALAVRMDAALRLLTVAAELERRYSKALEASRLHGVHRFERYGPARTASYVQQWSVGSAWRAEKIKAGLLPAQGE